MKTASKYLEWHESCGFSNPTVQTRLRRRKQLVTVRTFVQHYRLILCCCEGFVIPISPMIWSSSIVAVVLDVHGRFDDSI